MTRPAILVFARRPERGQVKTRLADRYGDDAALALHRAFLEDTLRLARRSRVEVVLAHTPGAPFAEQRLADRCIVQRGDGFAARFDNALADADRNLGPSRPLLVLGGDSPHLPDAHVRDALLRLETHDAVLGPNDGHGFWTIGFRAGPVPVAGALAEADQCAAIQRILHRHDRSMHRLAPFYDLDEPRDLQRLAAAWRSNGHRAPPRTRAVLEALGLL